MISQPAPAAARARVDWVDSARGTAIVLVVLFHAVTYSARVDLVSAQWSWTAELLRTIRMPLFFLVAGLFAGPWLTRGWRRLVEVKVLLFAWVYVLWLVLRWSWFQVVPPVSPSDGGSALVLLERLVLPVGGWFVVALALFFVAAKATRAVDPRVQVAVASLGSAAWLSGVHLGNHAWDSMATFYVFFLLGCYGRDAVFAAASRLTRVTGTAVVVSWLVAYTATDALGLLRAPGVGFLLRLGGVAAGVTIAVALSRSASLRHLGRHTLPVYLVHPLIIGGLVAAIAATGAAGSPLAAWVVAPAVAAVALALSYGVARAVGPLRLDWLFDVPAPLRRAFDRAWPAAPVLVAKHRSTSAAG